MKSIEISESVIFWGTRFAVEQVLCCAKNYQNWPDERKQFQIGHLAIGSSQTSDTKLNFPQMLFTLQLRFIRDYFQKSAVWQ